MIKEDDSEKRVKDTLKAELKKLGSKVYWFMPPANGYGRAGIPDFVICVCGYFLGVECKAPKKAGNLSDLQKLEMKKIRDAGGYWFLVYNDASVQALITEIIAITLSENE